MKRFHQHIATLLSLFGLFGAVGIAHASLSTDLQALDLQATALETHLQGVTVSGGDLCAQLAQANAMARDMVSSIETVNNGLAAPLQVDAAVYDGLDRLFATNVDIASEALRLSVDLQALSVTADMISLKDGITVMLQLSADIGTMADRIGEMADKILVMSDNIGLMADRILVTQQLQSDNVALTTNTVLQTQTNLLTVVSVVESSSYDLSLANLVTEGGLLAARMQAVMLSPWTMDDQLRTVASDVRSYLTRVQSVHDTIALGSTGDTIYISNGSLVELTNLSLMLTSLATALDGYVIAIDGLDAITSTPTLRDSLASMLQLSGDIGTMANRILEMADQILVMSDNIGLQANQILATQAAMNMNVATTQTAILGAQELAIGLIAARDL